MSNQVIFDIAQDLEHLDMDKVILVAIDGIDASGKSVFAKALSEAIKNRPVIRLEMDHFHQPKAFRTRRGNLSPEGYYYDSFDYDFIIREILEPIKAGCKTIPTQLFDYKTESSLLEKRVTLNHDTVIIFDGVFMLRDQLKDYWDYTIFLDISFDEALKRGLRRDIHHFKDQQQLVERYNKRYLPGQSLYLSEAKPKANADLVIDHQDFRNPIIVE